MPMPSQGGFVPAVQVRVQWLRRTLLGYLGQLTCPLMEELANALGDALSWNRTQKKYEVERAINILAERHGIRL